MSRRVLVVEDEEDLRDIARFTLEGAGFEVIEAVNGVEGVAKSKDGRPDHHRHRLLMAKGKFAATLSL
jgi:two-component system chemotaxis response regulator CheY